ncbi:MAG: DNRLRE domain-containing protein [Chloroflexota bacterium]
MISRRALGVLLLTLTLLAPVTPTDAAGARAIGSSQVLTLRYQIDRGAVPAWVTTQDVTLIIQVGAAERVWAWGDDQPVPVRHDPRQGRAILTTAASELTVALESAALQADAVGQWALATLRDDKQWAYSLTFDDGLISVYQEARSELRHYGYAAGVAVIGLWMNEDYDPVKNGYASPSQIRELIQEGWGVFNHSYTHSDAPSDISFMEVWRCQEAIRTQLDGYRAIVFTAPHTNRLWTAIIDNNTTALGLRMTQLMSDENVPLGMAFVDDPLVVGPEAAYHLGRRDIGQWLRAEFNYFAQAHGYAPRHAWVSLHAHHIGYDCTGVRCDWRPVSESLASLYHTYGPGGTDEVWVAPANQVFEYLVTRSYSQVSQVAVNGPAAEPQKEPWRASEWVTYRQGVNGFADWRDTYIHQWFPTTNYARSSLLVRGGVGDYATSLLQVEFAPPDDRAQVLEARLGLYGLSHSNPAGMDMTAYALTRAWDPAKATWRLATATEPWEQVGTTHVGEDRLMGSADVARSGGCEPCARWYTWDVTAAVQAWLRDPASNHGLLIEGPPNVAKGIQIASSEHPNVAWRPVLLVRYGWPEPEREPKPDPTATPTATARPTATASPTAAPRRIYLPLLPRSRAPGAPGSS